jgi:hypothetical protein
MTAPSRIGKYAIVRRLSRSMSDVYLAIDTVENRETALKLVKSAPDALSQMILEAERRGAAIQQELRSLDPRMIEVYDFGDVDGYFYVAMQYVEGRNLAQVLQAERRIEPRRAAQVAVEIAAQLAKFHTWQGGNGSSVVHGDIKPSNVHLSANDTVRLLDFGIAKMLRSGRDATMHNFGSPGYCAPERLSRLQVDSQSDLWALGATLYEMLAGRPPYQADDTHKLERVIQARRPPGALPQDCPPALRAIVGKSLAPEPAERYESAEQMRADLEAFLNGQTTLAEAQRQVRWKSPPTLEIAREYLRRVTRTIQWRGRSRKAAEGAIWFVLGMGLWIGGTTAWHAFRPKPAPVRPQAALPTPPPAVDPLAVLRSEYMRTADRAIEGYRAATDNGLRGFDWRLAEANLTRLVELGARDDEVAGKLALSRGFALLAEAPDRRTADTARLAFEEAAAKMPRSPVPQLGLTRVYIYAMPDIAKAFSAMPPGSATASAFARSSSRPMHGACGPSANSRQAGATVPVAMPNARECCTPSYAAWSRRING